MRRRWARTLGAAAVAYLMTVGSLTLLFGNPLVERILFTGEAGQSDKVLAVWLEQEPLPAVTPFWNHLGDIGGRGLVVQSMLLIWALAVMMVYLFGWAHRPGSMWWKGITFGGTVWVVLFLFFEASVPFNILGEPFPLVLLELSLQLVAMVVTGVAVALTYEVRSSST